MPTRDGLLEIAVAAEREYLALSAEHPPGTYHAGRNDAYDRMNLATICAGWMEDNGVAELANVGPFMSTELVRGQRVQVRKGATVFSTAPRHGTVITNRAITISVHDVYNGFVDRTKSRPSVTQGQVHWVGSGGYWRWTDINNVEMPARTARSPLFNPLTDRQQQVLAALDDAFRRPSDIASRAGIRTVSSRETAAKYCIELVGLGLAEKGGARMSPMWRLKETNQVQRERAAVQDSTGCLAADGTGS